MFYRTQPIEFLETLKSEWANTREEFLRVFDERDARLWSDADHEADKA